MSARRGTSRAILLIAVLVIALAPSGAGAATVVNGNFESGTLAGWQVQRTTEAGDWFAYKGTAAPIGSKRPNPADPVQAPPQGTYAAISDEFNPDTVVLYQDIALEADRTHVLSLLAYYDSYEPIAVPTPNTLSIDDGALGGQGNQQFRIDVMRPEAPLESIDPADILRTVFQTKPGDPLRMAPTKLSANLSSFAGQTVRLRIANAVKEEVFNAGVDAVSVSSTLPGEPASRGGSKQGPVLFSFGRVRAHPRNGIATLQVQVSGPGLVRATGASTPVPAVRTRGAGKLRKPIEPVTVPVGSAKTVTLHLRPTPAARAILKRKHRLRVGVTVTYMPTGGPSEAASVPVVFKLERRSRDRR
jgi:hypothetical protein